MNYNIIIMEAIVNQIHKSLLKKRKTIAVAESCTGGLLSSLLTRNPGSSKYFILGVVTYSNKAKETLLKIPHSIIAKNGAVSKPVAKLMAERIRKIAKTHFGIGITGIAGPGGLTPQKPVGTVLIAIDSKYGKICEKYHFRGNRLAIRKKAALKSLELLKRTF
jgi:PncC family amidohydrolase